MLGKTKVIAVITVSLSALGVLLFLLWLSPENIQKAIDFSAKNPLFAPLLLILWRFIAIVIPPIPGGVVSFALLPVAGWLQVWVFSSIGILAGTSTAFVLARKFREPLVRKFVPLQQLHKWEGKISKKAMEFWLFLGIRITTAEVMDFISYVSGLSKLTFRTFFLATAVSLIPNIFWYYLGEAAFKLSAYATAIFVIVVVLLLYVAKKKKFFEM